MINTITPPISDIAGVMGYTVHIPAVGTLVSYEGKYYELTSTTTHQEKAGVFVHMGTFLQVDDEGEYMDVPPVTLNLDNPGIEAM